MKNYNPTSMKLVFTRRNVSLKTSKKTSSKSKGESTKKERILKSKLGDKIAAMIVESVFD